MTKPTRLDYCQYLLITRANYTLTHYADHCERLCHDGQILASGISEGVIYLWDIDTGEQIKILKGHTGYIKNITYCKETKKLMSHSSDGTVLIWDISSQRKFANDTQ